jgi:deoxyribose-phosphate aldolase
MPPPTPITPPTTPTWQTLITRTHTTLLTLRADPTSPYHRTHAIPIIGSPAFTQTIDHTQLNPTATPLNIDSLCAEARGERFASVCVRGPWVRKCAGQLRGSGVRVAAVAGFHEGAGTGAEKAGEVRKVVREGAREVDVVVDWRKVREGRWEEVYAELREVREAMVVVVGGEDDGDDDSSGVVVGKVILETSQLDEGAIVGATVVAWVAGWEFVKTATGFCGHGATVEHVRLMRAACEVVGREAPFGVVRGEMKVKASGGVRTLEDAVRMLEAGASRLGTSAGVAIAKEARENWRKVGEATAAAAVVVDGEKNVVASTLEY